MKLPKTFVLDRDLEGKTRELLEETKPSVKPVYGGLDVHPLLNSKNIPVSQTQNEYIVQFNGLGKVMASLADYYRAGRSGDKVLIDSLRKDFSNGWIVGSDRIVYSGDSLGAKVIHYFGSMVIEPVEVSVFIPDYSDGRILDTVLDDERGLAYVQALFNTTDDSAEIKKTLSVLSGKNNSKIKVWTPDQGSRKRNPDRAAFLVYDGGDFFHIDGDRLSINGRSRGVRFRCPIKMGRQKIKG